MAGRQVWLPHARERPGIHHGLRPFAGNGYRREQRDFQLRGRVALAAAPGRPTRRGRHRGLDGIPRIARGQLPGVLVSRLCRHPRPQQELRRTRRVLLCHRRLHPRSTGAAQTEDGHAGQRQPVLADGRRADHRTRIHARRAACPRPRRRRHSRPHDVGAGLRIRHRRARPRRAHQWSRLHGRWCGAGVIYRHESVRAQ